MNLKPIIKAAIKEDLGSGDITTNSVIKKNKNISAIIIVEEPGIFCGKEVVQELCKEFNLKLHTKINDGDKVNKKDKILKLEGKSKDILKSERLILNFISFLSGISTVTNKYVEKVADNVKILDTRKTIPTLRDLQKYAVTIGGGHNHRQNLGEMVMIKDNHKDLVGLDTALQSVKKVKTGIEVECESLEEVQQTLAYDVNIIMLDNMSTSDMKQAVKIIKDKSLQIQVEASGGVTLETVEEISKTGVDTISVGRLTNHITPLKMKMEVELT